MATDPDYYTAWDGMSYPGEPPVGWFLAADNRWWPPREVIDTPVDEVAAQPAPAPMRRAEPSPPPESWAPQSNDVFDRTSPPQTPGPSGPLQPSRPRGRQRSGRQGGRGRGIGFIIFLVIAFGRCTANQFEDVDNEPDFPGISVPSLETTAAPFDPSAETAPVPTTQDLGSGSVLERNTGTVVADPARILSDDLDARLFPCAGQEAANGTVINRRPSAQSFLIVVQVEYLRAEGGNGVVDSRTAETSVGPVGPLEIVEWSIPAEQEAGLVVGCALESATPTGDS